MGILLYNFSPLLLHDIEEYEIMKKMYKLNNTQGVYKYHFILFDTPVHNLESTDSINGCQSTSLRSVHP